VPDGLLAWRHDIDPPDDDQDDEPDHQEHPMTTLLEPPASTVEAPVTTDTSTEAPRLMWAGFAVVLSAMILNILDSTIVNVAAPAIQRDLAMSTSSLEWVAAAYTLALAVGLMAGARLGDMFGRKRMLLLGLVGFVLSSAFCSFAWSGDVLVVARAAQGLSAALMVPQTFGLIRDLFPPQHIGKAFAAFGPVIGLSTVLGPVIAGLLMKADLLGTDWRALFLINLPLGVFALVLGAKVLPDGSPSHAGLRLDGVGTLLLGAASFLLVFPLVDGRTLGWPTWVFGVLAASLPMLAAFVLQQRARLRSGRAPLVEFSVLRKRSYVSGTLFTLVFFGSIVGFSLTMGLFLQIGLGFTAMHASLYLAAMAVGAFFGSGVGAWAATAVGRPILHVGLTIMAAGALLLWWSLRSQDGQLGFTDLAPGLFVFGVGMGMIFVPLFSIIMGEIDDHEVGSASGLLESLQQLGASLGVAVLGTLFFDKIALEDGGPGAAMAAGRHLVAAEDTLLLLVGLIAVAWCIGWFLPRRAREMV
jgi:EmrB/QacA subfamily drug resistance transporter